MANTSTYDPILDRNISTLDGMRKQHAIRTIYNLIGDVSDGFFTDDHWEPVQEIRDRMEQAGVLFFQRTSGYEFDEDWDTLMPVRKRWELKLPIRKKSGHEDTIIMNITAHGAADVDDPLARYDLTVVVS